MLGSIGSLNLDRVLLDYAADVFVQSTLLMLVVWGVQLWLRHHAPGFRRLLWLAALTVCPFLPVFSSMASRMGAPAVELELLPDNSVRGRWIAKEEVSLQEFFETVTPVPAHPELELRKTSGGSFNYYMPPRPPEDFPQARVTPVQWGEVTPEPGWLERVLVVAYVGGALGLVGVLAIGVGRMVSWVRRCEPVTDELALATFRAAAKDAGCEDPFFLVEGVPTSSPLTMGYLHPKILIPKGFGEGLEHDELCDIAKHELTHVRNRDPLSFVALASVRAVVFFNPLIWVGIRNLKLLAEQSADWSVAKVRERVLPYTRLLMRMAETGPVERSPAESVAGFLFGKSVLLKRSEALLSRKGGYANVGAVRKAVVLAAMIAGFGGAMALDVVPVRTDADPEESRERLPAVARVIMGATWAPDVVTQRWFLRLTLADGTTRNFEIENAPTSESYGTWFANPRWPDDPESEPLEHGSRQERELVRALENWLVSVSDHADLDQGEVSDWAELDVRSKTAFWVIQALGASRAATASRRDP